MAAVTNYEIVNPAALSQFSSTAGTITMDSSSPLIGPLSFLFSSAGTANIDYADLGGVADAGNGQLIECGLKFSHVVPGVGEAYELIRHTTLDPFTNLGLGFNDSGHTQVTDDGGVVRGVWANVLTADVWYNWAFYFENHATLGKLGPVRLAIAGQAYTEIIAQVTGLDTFDAAAPYEDRFLHNTFGTPPPQNTFNLGWYRHRSGCSGIGDMLGPPTGAFRNLGHSVAIGVGV